MPTQIEALSDTCLQIPCSFDAVPSYLLDKNKPFIGLWLKSTHNFGPHPESVVFNSSKTQKIYPISIIGNMSEYNCTTVFARLNSSYADTYYFRVENSPFKATATCNPLTITVKGKRTLLVWGSIFWLVIIIIIFIPISILLQGSYTFSISKFQTSPHSNFKTFQTGFSVNIKHLNTNC